MEDFAKLSCFLLFALFIMLKKHSGEKKMLCVRVKKFLFVGLTVFLMSSVLFATSAFADGEIFGELTKKGGQIFTGLRDIIFIVAGFGIIGVGISGFFGNLNWKWLGAIIIGLMVIATTAAIIETVTGQNIETAAGITDTLK